jgi:hypothetical protein
MCDGCRQSALSMVASAMAGPAQVGSRAPTTVIAKSNFRLTHLPGGMTFSHATSRTPAETYAAGGFDPAYSSEICYSGDAGPDHERWFDRMTFAARAQPGRLLSKVAEVQGYGTDKLDQGGHQYVYEFTAPAGTIVRSTHGAFAGEICFPEPIPYAWITRIHQVVQPGRGGGKRAFIPVPLPHLAAAAAAAGGAAAAAGAAMPATAAAAAVATLSLPGAVNTKQ